MKGKEKIYQYFEPFMNTKTLLIILSIGILFLFFSGLSKNEQKEEPQKVESEMKSKEYVKELEERLSFVLSTIKGAGKVSVMITLSDDGESVYAQDSTSERKPNNQELKATESRSDEKSYVLKNDSGGGQSPIVLVKTMPTVSGVLVTAQGADSERVKSDLISAIKAVLDVKAHRVQVFTKK